MNNRRTFQKLFVLAVVLYYLLPIAAIALASMTTSWSDKGLPEAFGLSGYINFWQTAEFRRSLWVSLSIAPVVVLLTIVTVVPAAYGIHLSSSRALKGAADAVMIFPLCVPALILAVGLLQTYGSKPVVLTGTIWIIALGHVVLASPYMYRSVSANLQALDTTTLIEAARSCGASPARSFVSVVAPNLGPGITSGSLLAFTTSFGEYQLAKMVSGFRFQTFPMKIWEAARREVQVQFAMSFIAVAIAFAAFLAITLIFLKSDIKEESVIV